MRIFGKIIGSILGLLCGGIYGLVFGFLLGHCYDAGYFKFLVGQNSLDHSLRKQTEFFRITFRVMGHIAKADGHVSQAEIEVAERIMSHMQLSGPYQQQAIHFFNEGKNQNFSLDSDLAELKQGRTRLLLKVFIEIQIQIALADKILSNAERAILVNICHGLGFLPEEFYQINFNREEKTFSSEQMPKKLSPYQILKIPANASNIELKNAYRHLISQYHPDKLISKGLPEELLKFATQKTQEIQGAYDEICKQRRL